MHVYVMPLVGRHCQESSGVSTSLALVSRQGKRPGLERMSRVPCIHFHTL